MKKLILGAFYARMYAIMAEKEAISTSESDKLYYRQRKDTYERLYLQSTDPITIEQLLGYE